MSKKSVNNKVFSTLGSSNHSIDERQKEDGTLDKNTKLDWIRYK